MHRHIIKLSWNSWKYWNLLSDELHICLPIQLRNHVCVQFYFANYPLPGFSDVPIVTSLSHDLRVGANWCCKTKAGFSFSSCDTREICKKCMQISSLLPYLRDPSVYIVWKVAAEFVFVLQFRKLPYPVFHGYDVIALQLSPVEGAITRYLVSSCWSRSWISLAKREDLNMSL